MWLAATGAAQAAGFVCTSGTSGYTTFPGLTVGNDSAATTIRFARSVSIRHDNLQGTLPDSLPAMRVRRAGSVRYVADVTGYFSGTGRGDGLAVVVSLPDAPTRMLTGVVSLVRVDAAGTNEAIIDVGALSCVSDAAVGF
jgi:hypothetical protein